MRRRSFLCKCTFIAAGGAVTIRSNWARATSLVEDKETENYDDSDSLCGDDTGISNPVSTSFSKRSYRVNVKDFGAVSGTDCSIPVQRAIDHVETLGGYDVRDSGGEVEFGPGIWYINRVVINKFGIRFVGAGRRATIIANRSRTEPMLLIIQGDRSVTPIIADIGFENLQFRNTVDRDDGADFLIRGILAERLLFNSVDFVSSALAPSGNRSPLRCNFIQTATFQSRWSNCNFWGILGCAIEIPDGPQADTILFDGCVWAYCSIAGLFGLGKAAGNNGIYFISCKVIGNQGGGYVSASSDNFASTIIVAATISNKISVECARNFVKNQTIVIGENAGTARYAFVRNVSGNMVELDRKIVVAPGDRVVQGRIGFVFGHVLMPRIQSSQFEGCDVGVYLLGGKRLSVDSTIIASCARGILINSDFDYLRISACIGATMGQMKNDVAWRFVTISNITNSRNVVDVSGSSVERSGYAVSANGGFVVNEARFPILLLDDGKRLLIKGGE